MSNRSLWGGVRQALLVAVLIACSLSLYLAVLKWRGPAAVLTTETAWDGLLPFWPEWVWAYLLPYLVAPVVMACLSRPTFRWFVPRALAVVGVTLTVFILVPTQTGPRPPATDLRDGLTAKMYHDMVEIDEPPANAAPSLHVSLTFLLAWALFRDFPRWWPLTCLGVGVVWLSTLVTRQHHLIDVATGALVALVVGVVWPFGRERVTR